MGHEDRVRRVVKAVRACRDRGIETFGSVAHGFASVPVPEAEIVAFESAHRVRLPDDFRAWLLCAGSGAGRYYGILPVARFGELFDDASAIARPFLFAPGTPRTEAAFEDLARGIGEPVQGAVAITDQGCGHRAALVVAGPYRGRVVYVAPFRMPPYFVDSPDFLSWIERWTDELLAGARHTWFGVDLSGDEASLAAVAAAPAAGAGALRARGHAVARGRRCHTAALDEGQTTNTPHLALVAAT